jgi:putative transposase
MHEQIGQQNAMAGRSQVGRVYTYMDAPLSVQLTLWDNGPSGTEGTMKKTRFSEERMVKILREADKAPVSEVAKKHGVSDLTIYAWRKRFVRLEAVDVKHLRQLEGLERKVLAEQSGSRDAISPRWSG